MLQSIDLLRLAGDRMRYLTERQNVIGRNIANADTPGYQAQDLAPFSGKLTASGSAGQAAPLQMASTSSAHLAGAPVSGDTAAPFHIQSDDSSTGEKPDGNTVSLEDQMIKSADVANAFAMASAVYAKTIGLLKIGIDNK